MKITFLAPLFLALAAAAGFAAGPMEEFYGLTFGASPDDVKTSLESRGAPVRAKQDPAKGPYRVAGLAYGGRETQLMTFYFADGKLARVSVLFPMLPAGDSFAFYEKLQTAMAGKYGKETRADKRGVSERRILEDLWRKGEAIETRWQSPGNSIVLRLEGKGRLNALVTVEAEDRKLATAIAKEADKL